MRLSEALTTAVTVPVIRSTSLSPVESRGGWWPLSFISEPFSGAWQQNQSVSADTALAYHAVFACVTLISADVGKMRVMLVEQDKNGIWAERASPAFSPVLRKPNRFQNHIQFKEWWTTSKLVRGNAYVLLERDNRGIVVRMYLLDPNRVTVLVSPDGSVFYELQEDNLSGLDGTNIRVPASEIIHDRMNCLFHPLVGVSPIYACSMAADQGLRIQRNQSTFFANNSSPGGILIAPGSITDANAKRLKDYWEANYTGEKAGRIAVLGDGLKFEPMRMTAVDSQLIEQLKMTAEIVCSCFHVPPFMIGVGNAPTYNNIEALSQQYYSQCLQSHIESMELCLDEGLGLDTPKDGAQMGTMLDLDGLLRMDQATQMETLAKGVAGALLTPNDGRKKLNQPPLPGGDTVYMQVQNYSIAALAERDKLNPLALPAPALPTTEPAPSKDADEFEVFMSELTKGFEYAI